MWLNLCLLIVLSCINTHIRSFELKSAFFKTLRNPGLPYMTRYAWKQKNPAKFYQFTKPSHDYPKQRDSSADFWIETTTELSVLLGNIMLSSPRQDHINNYIEYLTRIKGLKLNIRSLKARDLNKVNTSIVETNKTSNISDPMVNGSDTSMKQTNDLSQVLTTSLIEFTKQMKGTTRYSRKSEQFNVVNSDIDNSIESTKPTKRSDSEILDGDKDLIQSNKKLKDLKESDNLKETYKDIIKYCTEINNTLNESNKCQSAINKEVKEIKYLKKSDVELRKSHEKMKKEGDKELTYSEKYRNEIDKGIKEIVRDLKISARNMNKKYEHSKINSKTNNTNFKDLQNIFSTIAIIRLLADIQKRKSRFSVDITTSLPDVENIDFTTSREKLKNITKPPTKAVKFVIPKADINNADAVFIVFRNQTGIKNYSFDTNNNVNFGQDKYKKAKQIVFKPDKRRKISKLMLDGAIPDWLGTKLKQFTKKISFLNDLQKDFVTKASFPVYRTRRSLKKESKQTSRKNNNSTTSKSNKTRRSKDPTANLLHVLPIWQLNENNKARATRSSIFGRRYRSPNKFRIIVRPTKRDNKLGQVSVHIYREYKPLVDVAGYLKKYYSFNISSTQSNDFKLKNIKVEPFLSLTDMDKLNDKYLGLNAKLIGKSINYVNNDQKHNTEKLCKHVLSDNENKCDDAKTENPNMKITKKEAEIPNQFIIENDFVFPNVKLNDVDDYTQSIDPITKQLSMLFPRSRRLVRDIALNLNSHPERNSIMIFTKNQLNSKFFNSSESDKRENRSAYLAPHIDQQSLVNFMNGGLFSKLNARDVNSLPERNSIMIFTKNLLRNSKFFNKSPYLTPHTDQKTYVSFLNSESYSKLDNKTKNDFHVHKKKPRNHQKSSYYTRFRKAVVTTTENVNRTPKQISSFHTKKQKPRTLQDGARNIFGFLKHYLWKRQQIGLAKNKIKSNSNLTKLNFYDKPKNKLNINSNYKNRIKSKDSNCSSSNSSHREENLQTQENKNISELTQNSEIKNSRKRELGSPGVFSVFIGDMNDNHNHEEMFNVDIGSVGQADVFEQLAMSDEDDAEQYPADVNNTDTLVHQNNEKLKRINLKKQKLNYNHNIDLKDTMWFNPIKRITTMMPKKRKHLNRKDIHSNATAANTTNTTKSNAKESANLYGYENLSTARKLYSDLDPVNSEENAVAYSEKDHKYNRAIKSMHLHPLLDDYNDEFLRDTNVESNRVGVDYINYNYLGPGIDFPDFSQAKYDKYADFAAEFSLEMNENFKQKEIKLPKQDVPKVQDKKKKEKEVQTSKRVYINKFNSGFDYMNLDEKDEKHIISNLAKSKNVAGRSKKLMTTLPTRLPKPAEVINLFYNHNARRKQMSQSRDKHNSTRDSVRNERKKLNTRKNKNQTLPFVHIHTEPTTEFVANDIQYKNMNVYVHKQKALRRKNNLHNSRHLLALWSQNHDAKVGNSVVAGISPLDMWTHKVFHQPRPTPEQFEQFPEEVEFDRRKRDVNMKRSRLVCCVIKRLEQQELVKHVKATWGRRCDVIVFIASKGAENHIMWEYTKAGLRFIYELHYKDADWILKADIDSYILVENLKNMVKEFDPQRPLYFGSYGKSDFSNFVLSKEALQILITRSQDSETCQGSVEEGIGYCLEYLGIKSIDSRDKLGRARFYPFSPFDYDPFFKHTSEEGLSTWSDYAVAFGKVSYKDMYSLDYFIYRIQPLNTSKEILQRISNITFTDTEEIQFTKPPHSKLKLTEKLRSHFQDKDREKTNNTKRLTLKEFKDKIRQLNGLF